MPNTKTQRIDVTFTDAVRIIWPHFYAKTSEQVGSLLPITGYLFVFQLLVLRIPVYDSFAISLGLLVVLFGLTFFLEGLRLGLMPFSDIIGSTLPRKSSLYGIVAFAFIVGVGATLAEPAIGTLKLAAENIEPDRAVLLHALLTRYSGVLVIVVGAGVGVATALGLMRFLYNWSLKIFIVPIVVLLAALTAWAQSIPEVAATIGLAWDCGAVTTGPVTVPLVLALGMGVSRITGRSDTGMSGFGIVTLASLFPIIAVLSLGFYIHYSAADLAALSGPGLLEAPAPEGSSTLFEAMAFSFRAVMPLCLFLFFVQRFVFKEGIRDGDEIALGIVFMLVGMGLFNLGLSFGLTPLGNQVGNTLPATFSEIMAGVPPEPFGPLYWSVPGKAVAIVFGFFLGYGATMAEPALNAMGMKVEEITVGAFKKSLLIKAVSLGVGVGIACGVAKIIFNIPLTYMILPPYALALLLSVISSEEFVNIGWDSAGVTTGPITVPLVIAMGLGVGSNIPGAAEGFGILALASIFPILSVLAMGLLVRRNGQTL
jgi:hypothetical protein